MWYKGFVCTGTNLTSPHVHGKAKKAANALSRLLHNLGMTTKPTYSHSSSEKENELNAQIEHVSSNTELGNQTTKSSNNESIPKQKVKRSGETYLSSHQKDVKDAHISDRKCKKMIDGLLLGS